MNLVLIVSRNSKVLLEIPLDRPKLYIGQSSLCNGVIRSNDMDAIHFLIEAYFKDNFNPSNAEWMIFDLTNTEHSRSGFILGSTKNELSGFVFEVKEKKLSSASKYRQNFINQSVKDLKYSQVNKEASLEMMEFDGNVLSEIRHFQLVVGEGIGLTELPVKLKIRDNFYEFYQCPDSVEFFKDNEKISCKTPVKIEDGFLYRIRYKNRFFVVRSVRSVHSDENSFKIYLEKYSKLIFLFVVILSFFTVFYWIIGLSPGNVELKKMDLLKKEVEIYEVKIAPPEEKQIEPLIKVKKQILTKQITSKINKQSTVKAKKSVSSQPFKKLPLSRPSIKLFLNLMSYKQSLVQFQNLKRLLQSLRQLHLKLKVMLKH